MRPRTRFILWFAVLAVLLVGQLVWLWCLRGPRILQTSVLVGGGVLLLVPVAVVAMLLFWTPSNAIRLSSRLSIAIILGGAALLQATAIAWIVPAVGSDLARYRLDGGMWISSISPYRHTLNDTISEFEHGGRFAPDKIDCDVAERNQTTRYLPVAEATFALGRASEFAFCPPLCVNLTHEEPSVHPWQDHVLNRPWIQQAPTFRILFALATLGAACVLMILLHRSGQSVWWAALFAWCPVVVLGAGGIGRYEFVALLLALLAILAARRAAVFSCVVFIGLACGTSPLALLSIPFLIQARGSRLAIEKTCPTPTTNAVC